MKLTPFFKGAWYMQMLTVLSFYHLVCVLVSIPQAVGNVCSYGGSPEGHPE